MRTPYSKTTQQKVLLATIVGVVLILVIWAKFLLPLTQRQLLQKSDARTNTKESASSESLLIDNIKETFTTKKINKQNEIPKTLTTPQQPVTTQ